MLLLISDANVLIDIEEKATPHYSGPPLLTRRSHLSPS